jgi:hypothetical protein
MMASVSCSGQGETLAVESLRRAGRLRMRVRGESMLPTLWPNDIVEIERCSLADVVVGDIVLGFRDTRFFLHRFVATCDRGFLMRGDSMPGVDPAYPSDALLGKLIRVERAGREVAASRWAPFRRAFGFVICYCPWVRRLAFRIPRLMTAPEAQRLSMDDLTSDVCNREAR